MALVQRRRRAGGTANQSGGQTVLPGAERLAVVIERRSFLRRLGNTLFYSAVASSAGALSLSTILADPAAAQTGACCPSCCGPSPCCGTSCCGADCCRPRDQWDTGGPCKDSTSGQCRGKWTGTGGYNDACWCCFVGGSPPYRKCCDCKIASGCGGRSHCICHKRVQSLCDA
jgi:hypothetical protein